MRQLLELERAALRRLLARPGMTTLALFGASVGALGFVTALLRARAALLVGAPETFAPALAAVPLGLDLAIVLGSLAFGAGVAAIARPAPAGQLAIAAARSSAGALSIAMLVFFVSYALLLGVGRLVPSLLDVPGSAPVRAALAALALAPVLAVSILLAAGATAALALVGRGLPPGQALASGLDHVQRRPLTLALCCLHAIAAVLLARGAMHLPLPTLPKLVLMAPLLTGTMLWTVAALDAALGADSRLATG